MVAITLITALPEKPSNRCSTGTTPVRPSTTNTSKAVTSARSRSHTNMTMVNNTRAVTIQTSMDTCVSNSMSGGLRVAELQCR